MTSKLQEMSQWIKENQLKSIGKRSLATPFAPWPAPPLSSGHMLGAHR